MDSGGREVLPNCDSPHPKTNGINGAWEVSLLSLSPLNLE